MNQFWLTLFLDLGFIILLVLVASMIPPQWDPTIRLKERNERKRQERKDG